jgi:hypothetical protein
VNTCGLASLPLFLLLTGIIPKKGR